MKFPFRPRLVDALRGYTWGAFGSDLTAGLTVGIVALPLAMAFAIASGFPPQAGIFTAVIAGLIVSALGGTRVCIGGPTGAFIVILYGILTEYGAGNLAICTIMAGVILFIMGAARLGTMIKFIPYPVTMGFTSGIAVLIFSTQVKDFFGLRMEKVPSEFIEKMQALTEHADTLHVPSFLLAAASLAIILAWPKSWQRKVPSSIGTLVLGAVAVAIGGFDVQTIGSKFGGIPQGLYTGPRLEAGAAGGGIEQPHRHIEFPQQLKGEKVARRRESSDGFRRASNPSRVELVDRERAVEARNPQLADERLGGILRGAAEAADRRHRPLHVRLAGAEPDFTDHDIGQSDGLAVAAPQRQRAALAVGGERIQDGTPRAGLVGHGGFFLSGKFDRDPLTGRGLSPDGHRLVTLEHHIVGEDRRRLHRSGTGGNRQKQSAGAQRPVCS